MRGGGQSSIHTTQIRLWNTPGILVSFSIISNPLFAFYRHYYYIQNIAIFVFCLVQNIILRPIFHRLELAVNTMIHRYFIFIEKLTRRVFSLLWRTGISQNLKLCLV